MKLFWRIAVPAFTLAIIATAYWMYGRPIEPKLPTTQVTRGAFNNVVEIRGEVRPLRSTIVLAPPNAGELTIVKIAKNGSAVKAGEIVGEFDAMAMRQKI